MEYTNPNQFPFETDSQRIQAAVDAAVETGCFRVVIPSENQRTGQRQWIIDKTILLPSNMHIEIDNAHLRMADGVMCRMFQNTNAGTELATKPEGLQENIVIRGRGCALLDGGNHNGLREDTYGKNGMPSIYENLTIFFHNVRNFRIEGLTIRDQRWWSMAMTFCWEGVISDICFEITDKAWRKGHPLNPTHPWRNQDGIDLRCGCHDIEIRNITGETGDDVIALTALGEHGTNPNRLEDAFYCEHLTSDIYNVTIRNIKAFCNHCAIVRLLCHFGNKIHHIRIENVVDDTPDESPIPVSEGQRTACCIKLGENGYHRNDPQLKCQHGDLSDISIHCVRSNALSAVNFNCSVRNCEIRDIYVAEKGRSALTASLITGGKHTALDKEDNATIAENVLLDGVTIQSQREDALPFFFYNLQAKNFRIQNVRGDIQPLSEFLRPHKDSEPILWK